MEFHFPGNIFMIVQTKEGRNAFSSKQHTEREIIKLVNFSVIFKRLGNEVNLL